MTFEEWHIKEYGDTITIGVLRVKGAMLAAWNAGQAAMRERAAAAIPGNWLDPLLSGPERVVSSQVNCQDVERVLQPVKKRLLELPIT